MPVKKINPIHKRRREKSKIDYKILDLIDDHAIKRRVCLTMLWSWQTRETLYKANMLLDIIDAKPNNATPVGTVVALISILNPSYKKQDIADLGGMKAESMSKTCKSIYDTLKIKPIITKRGPKSIKEYPDIDWGIVNQDLMDIYKKRLGIGK